MRISSFSVNSFIRFYLPRCRRWHVLNILRSFSYVVHLTRVNITICDTTESSWQTKEDLKIRKLHCKNEWNRAYEPHETENSNEFLKVPLDVDVRNQNSTLVVYCVTFKRMAFLWLHRYLYKIPWNK